MKTRILALALAALALPGALCAEGMHGDGQGHAAMAIGAPAEGAADRTIEIRMSEREDGAMIFEPAALNVSAGETVRLKITNDGETEHEFVMDTMAMIQEHKALMERSPEMDHDDPNAVRLDPGETGEILWTFGKAGRFEFACLLPGHYESGMHGSLTVE